MILLLVEEDEPTGTHEKPRPKPTLAKRRELATTGETLSDNVVQLRAVGGGR